MKMEKRWVNETKDKKEMRDRWIGADIDPETD